MTVTELIVPQCKGCTMPDIMTGRCTVFVDPLYQHRDGRKCWGRCDSIDEMVRRLEAICEHNPTNATYKRELEDWRETQREVSAT